MDATKPSRAQRMAETYEAVLVRDGVLKPKAPPADPRGDSKDQPTRGEINWWQLCLGQPRQEK